jgi:hypothetical protein
VLLLLLLLRHVLAQAQLASRKVIDAHGKVAVGAAGSDSVVAVLALALAQAWHLVRL